MPSALRELLRNRPARTPRAGTFRPARPLDIRAASLTPDHRAMMLALVEQDARERRKLAVQVTVAGLALVVWVFTMTGVLTAVALRVFQVQP